MKLQYKLVLILITSLQLQAQKHHIYSKSFDVNKQTTVIFNLENTTVGIEESTDDKIHFDYAIEFENYSKKEMKKILEEINVEANMFDNHLTLVATSVTKISNTTYVFNSLNGLMLKEGFFTSSDSIKDVVRKPKDSIIKQINISSLDDFRDFFKMFKTTDDKGKEKNINTKNVKMHKSVFTIKIPSYLKLTINGKESQVTMLSNFQNELRVNLKSGFLKAKQLSNTHNKIKVENASFKVEDIIGGDYTLNNIRNGLIGSIKNTNITSEFSKIEIGEIGENITITDFNSKFWFYNWSEDFTRFDMFSEYSKIHLFYPETDFSFQVFGNNTINHIDDFKIKMQPTKSGEKYNMMSRKAINEGHFSGAINFDIIHGVIYTYSDTFTPNKN